MIQNPTITTIIPTYRRPNLLRRAIQSVLKQTYPYFQVCVYDNASGDETASIVAEFSGKDSRVKYHCQPDNIGGFNNFQYGLEHVCTPYFSFLSDDDMLLPNFYETAMAEYEAFPDAMFCATDVIRLFSENKNILFTNNTYRSGYFTPPDGLLRISQRCLLWTGILFRREVKEVVGLLDESVGSPSDDDFIYRAAAKCPFIISKRPGAIFSCRGQVYFQPKSGLRKMIHNLDNLEIKESLMNEIRNNIITNHQYSLFRFSLNLLEHGDSSQALKFSEELKESPGSTVAYASYAKALEINILRKLLGASIRIIRKCKHSTKSIIRMKYDSTSPDWPKEYHDSDIINIKSVLSEM